MQIGQNQPNTRARVDARRRRKQETGQAQTTPRRAARVPDIASKPVAGCAPEDAAAIQGHADRCLDHVAERAEEGPDTDAAHQRQPPRNWFAGAPWR
ncbi:MAG: hypothetical protein HC893_17205 [Chloroflexaceae bacterium]|nr:hypothetical protein [Chloroflexaceae bacterium]